MSHGLSENIKRMIENSSDDAVKFVEAWLLSSEKSGMGTNYYAEVRTALETAKRRRKEKKPEWEDK